VADQCDQIQAKLIGLVNYTEKICDKPQSQTLSIHELWEKFNAGGLQIFGPSQRGCVSVTSRKDPDGRQVYTKGGKDYVKRKKTNGTFGMRQAT
jgi:hypothetical protein